MALFVSFPSLSFWFYFITILLICFRLQLKVGKKALNKSEFNPSHLINTGSGMVQTSCRGKGECWGGGVGEEKRLNYKRVEGDRKADH